jgi:hypothetical protein
LEGENQPSTPGQAGSAVVRSSSSLPPPHPQPQASSPDQIRARDLIRGAKSRDLAAATRGRPRQGTTSILRIEAAAAGRRCRQRSAAMRPPPSLASSAPPPRSSSHVTISSQLALFRFLFCLSRRVRPPIRWDHQFAAASSCSDRISATCPSLIRSVKDG